MNAFVDECDVREKENGMQDKAGYMKGSDKTKGWSSTITRSKVKDSVFLGQHLNSVDDRPDYWKSQASVERLRRTQNRLRKRKTREAECIQSKACSEAAIESEGRVTKSKE
jgi:hypothetical protein